MTLVRSETGGVSIGDYTWEKPGDVADLPDELAYEIAGLNPDFSVIEEKSEKTEPDGSDDESDDESDGDEPDDEGDTDKPVKRGPGRPRKATT